MLLMQEIERALALALLNAGSSMAASIAIIAMTTNSSIKVNLFFIVNSFLLFQTNIFSQYQANYTQTFVFMQYIISFFSQFSYK